MQKFGVREICNVVLKAKAAQKVGKKIFYKNEPVMYFDTLKTSSLEGQSSTVYAQGGRGNPRLVAWEGERTVTFTMEDALISAEGLSILTGAGLIDAKDKTVYQHVTEILDIKELDLGTDYADMASGKIRIPLSNLPYLPSNQSENFAYVMFMREGEIITEPYIPVHGVLDDDGLSDSIDVVETNNVTKYWITVSDHTNYVLPNSYADLEDAEGHKYSHDGIPEASKGGTTEEFTEGNYDVREFPFVIVGESEQIIPRFDSVLVDYYVAREAGATQIEITADKFGGNYYLEAETLFRNQNGQDMPAEFVIPNCKIQSNFTFTMANSGDPSTFTFTMDAFPDYTRFDHTHKVFAAIQIIESLEHEDLHRHSTAHEPAHDGLEWF
jgi:hypothetical protein